MTIDCLPKEVLSLVIVESCEKQSYVNWRRCALVCKKWNAVVKEALQRLPQLEEFLESLKKRIEAAPVDRYLKIAIQFPCQPKFKIHIETGSVFKLVLEESYLLKDQEFQRVHQDSDTQEEIGGIKESLNLKIEHSKINTVKSTLKAALRKRRNLLIPA